MLAELVPAYTEVDHLVSDRTRERITAGTAANTRRAYAQRWRLFSTWCARVGRVALPATAHTVAEYVAHLADCNRAPGTIELAVAAIRAVHRNAEYPYPDTGAARKILRAHRRTRARNGQRSHVAPPISIDGLRAMVAACDTTTARGQCEAVIVVLGWALMGRRSELAALHIGDVVETQRGLEVLIRASKTDQDALGVIVAIPHGQHPETDPVRVVRRWVNTLRTGYGVTTGALIRSVCYVSTTRDVQIGDSIDPRTISYIVRRVAVRAGIPRAGEISAHSLRAGGATAAYAAGNPVTAIAEHGRWAPNSPVVLRYIRAVDRWRDNAMRNVGM